MNCKEGLSLLPNLQTSPGSSLSPYPAAVFFVTLLSPSDVMLSLGTSIRLAICLTFAKRALFIRKDGRAGVSWEGPPQGALLPCHSACWDLPFGKVCFELERWFHLPQQGRGRAVLPAECMCPLKIQMLDSEPPKG